MAVCFKRKERVGRGVRRLGRKQCESALECLTDGRETAAVHGARKNIKKARAILRLVQPQIDWKLSRRQKKLFRKAAAKLSPLRDACVAAGALKNLRHHFKGRLSANAFRGLDLALRETLDRETKQFRNDKIARSAERILKRAAKGWNNFKLERNGWKAIQPGLKAAYQGGQRAYRAAFDNPTPENFHEWRKRAKDLWFQLLLLRPIWPDQLDEMTAELEALSDCLGNDHDLVMLQEAAAPHETKNDARELETLEGLANQRHGELRASALALGARFYAEKPRLFCHRLAGYWQAWRGEKRKLSSLENRRPSG